MTIVPFDQLKNFDLARALGGEKELPEPYHSRRLDTHAQSGDPVYFLFDDANLVGFFVGRIIGEEAELLFIYVLTRYRRHGFGKPLLRSFIETATAAGATVVFLEVSVKNKSALALYLSLGFKEVGLRRHYYSDGTDALLMRRQLNRVAE